MKQEDMFAVARAAEFTRVKTCCEGVENKLCANDEWRGNLAALVTKVERQAIQRCIDFIRNGSFLTEDSPAKQFADEVTAEMEKQLMPYRTWPVVKPTYESMDGELLEVTPENLGKIAFDQLKRDPFGANTTCLPDRRQMLSPVGSHLGSPDNPVKMTEEFKPAMVPTRPDHKFDPLLGHPNAMPAKQVHYTSTPPVTEDGVALPPPIYISWETALVVFRTHITQKLLRRGLHVLSIEELLTKHANAYSAEIDEVLQELLRDADRLSVKPVSPKGVLPTND